MSMHMYRWEHMASFLLSRYPGMEMPGFEISVTFFKKLENSSGTWLEYFTFLSPMHENSGSCYMFWLYVICYGLIQIKPFSIFLCDSFLTYGCLEMCCLLSKYRAIYQISFCCWFLIKFCCGQRKYFVWSQFF